MGAGKVTKGGQGFGGVFNAAGVVGRDEDDGLGTRCDQGGGKFGVGDQTGAGFQSYRPNPRHIQPHLMVEIPRGWQDHLIPRPSQSGHNRAKRLIAALGDGRLLRGDLAAVSKAPLPGDFGAECWQAKDGAVKMRVGVVEAGIGNRLPERQRRQVDRGGLRDVDQRAIRRKGQPRNPAPRLHHRRR